MTQSKLNVNPDDMIERGVCDCGQACYARWRDGKSVFMCDECVVYFDAGFNVVVAEEN